MAEAAAAVDRLLINVGAGALECYTLRRRLLADESPAVAMAQELPGWLKGPNGPVSVP
ncbi:hypothetical protein [Synechococcus sp. CBW1107]|uniref:hypothetical protein n=1 Tax=Synechococcus sp. CBW1107 TaxID=2789857 RepID=UPI002AD52214|nr:hypothetical protein [Synechococcus sp. CBW1107]